MEIGRLVRNPVHKLRQRLIFEQGGAILPDPRKLRIGEICVDGAVTNGMHGHGRAALLRLGNCVMLLDLTPQRAFAQPAAIIQGVQPFFAAAFFFFMVS